MAYRLAEFDMRVDRLSRLYELKEKGVQRLIGRFGSVLKTIAERPQNASDGDRLESLMAAYDRSVEMARWPMARLDVYTFLPHLQSDEHRLRPSVLRSGGRQAGEAPADSKGGFVFLWYRTLGEGNYSRIIASSPPHPRYIVYYSTEYKYVVGGWVAISPFHTPLQQMLVLRLLGEDGVHHRGKQHSHHSRGGAIGPSGGEDLRGESLWAPTGLPRAVVSPAQS